MNVLEKRPFYLGDETGERWCGTGLCLGEDSAKFRNIFHTSGRISSDYKLIPEQFTFLRYRLLPLLCNLFAVV